MSLASCAYVRKAQNIIITGPTGVGKTYLACALAHKACLEGYAGQYQRLPKLLTDLSMVRGDGRYPKVMAAYAKADLLVLDDGGIDRPSREERLTGPFGQQRSPNRPEGGIDAKEIWVRGLNDAEP